MSSSTRREPGSAHWLFLYLLHRMKQVLEHRGLTEEPSFNSWVRHRHVTFIVADELRRKVGLDFGLQTTLHIEDIRSIANGPTIVNIVLQCFENEWIMIKEKSAKLYDLTPIGQMEVDRVLKENRSIACLGCPHGIPADSLIPMINDLVDYWSLASMTKLPDFYREVVLRGAINSQTPVSHYEIHRSQQAECFIAAARR